MFSSGPTGIIKVYVRPITTIRPLSKTQPLKRTAKQGCTVSRKHEQPAAMTGCMRPAMNEKDVVNLYQSLARCRDGFMQTRTRRDESQPVKRLSERDRDVMECFRNR
nr:MAG TPA_asm: hypothetical protein [Caudoviricetes sp.]